MSVSYNKLWKMLIDQKMSHIELQRAAEVAPNTMTKMRRDEPVNLAILDRICRVLGCDFGEIVEHFDDVETADFVREFTLASGGPYCDCGYKKRRM